MTKTLKAIYGSPEKPLILAGQEIQCYVLENEQRVISQQGLIYALGMSKGSSGKQSGDRIAKFMSGKLISPYVPEGLYTMTQNPIKFKPPRGEYAWGYDATILAEICDAVLEARKAGALQAQQAHIADRCEELMRGFAIVGIIALVDEATGYQNVRRRNELNEILQAYIAPELMPWTQRFPNAFYEEIFRLNGWPYNPRTVKRPGVIGTWTNKYVYEQLPPGVLAELKKKTPRNTSGNRKHQYHRLLTADVGNPHLEKQLVATMTLFRAATSWAAFKGMFARSFKTGQQRIDFKDDDDK